MDTNGGSDRMRNCGETNGDALDASQIAEARLTAYILGELDADERAAVETELETSAAARSQITEIRRSVELVTAALATEPLTEKSALDRNGVSHGSRCNVTLERRSVVTAQRVRYHITTRYALAASLLVCLTGGTAWLMWPEIQQAREAGRVAARIEQIQGQIQHDLMGRARSVRTVPHTQYRTSLQSEEQGVQFSEDNSAMPGEPEVPHTFHKPVYDLKEQNEGRPNLASPHWQADDVQYFAVSGETMSLRDRSARGAMGVDGNSLFGQVDPTSNSSGDSAGPIITPRVLIQEEEAPLEGFLQPRDGPNTESYDRIFENPFLEVRQNPLSTFSIDVDTASYANVRRFLNGGSRPPKDAVRIEELVNYFTYHYAPPADEKPFAVHAEVAGCPWEPKHRLLRIALKGREIDLENRPASNLVFLIDVSGSMDEPAKLPLLKSALHLLVDKLGENDRVAMVVYAGSSGLVLPSTSGLYRETILAALDQLQAGGSTNGGSGIQLAYQVAREKLIRGGTNRVILCTDGDFNVGVTDQGSLTRLIEDEAKSGVFLSVLGFGAGNLKDSTMEKLADRGNGNYAYIDTLNEGRKVLVEQLGGTLVTIAKDVKLQLEFNPKQVAAYRLIGYENRLLRADDFNDDKKDAGEIGAGHTVTALYELVPAGAQATTSKVDELKYQRTAEAPDVAANDELLTLKLRYKEPDGDTSKLMETVVKDGDTSYARASEDYRFASAVAGFGLLLGDSQFKGDLTWGAVLELAEASRGADENGYRAEFIELLKKARSASGK